MKDNAAGIYDICKKYGINPAYAFGHACVESGYGTSSICQNKNNYFGMGAYNDDPSGSASSYSSILASTEAYCKWVKQHATPGTSEYEADKKRGEEFAAVNPTFVGTPSDNIYVLFSRYAVLDSTHHGGSAFDAKYMYRYALHKADCGHADGTPTTTLEYSEWSEYTTNERIRIARELFGINAFPNTGGVSAKGDMVNGAGDGYDYVYQSGSRKYKLYEQWKGSYSGNGYGGTTISSYGCGPTSVAIIASGYNPSVTPATVVSECKNITNANGAGWIESVRGYLEHYGFKVSKETGGNSVEGKNKIISHLKSGNPVILLVQGTVKLANGGSYSYGSHYITLLGIDEKNQVFVGDPGSWTTDGYSTMDILSSGATISDYFLINK